MTYSDKRKGRQKQRVNVTKVLSIGLGQLYVGIQKNAMNPKRSRTSRERPLIMCTLNMQNTVSTVLEKRRSLLNNQFNTKQKIEKKNFGNDDEHDDYIIQPGEIFNERFQVQRLIGKGSFGQVVEALETKNQALVAIKIIKNRKSFTNQGHIEMRILRYLNTKDVHDEHHIVKIQEHFFHKNHLCIVYEMLSINLYDVLKRGEFQGLPLPLVRRFSYQLLIALKYLSRTDIQVIHCDLKPENILLMDDVHANIKVIDFGSSCFMNEKIYTYIQSRFYRSPEVIFGHSYTTAIDMWSLGCVLMELLCGEPIFAGASEHDQLCKICEFLGLPPIEMIEKSPVERIERDFIKVKRGQYRLIPSGNSKSKNRKFVDLIKEKMDSLEQGLDAVCSRSDYFHFLDFIGRMLMYNPEDRMTPTEALQHPFLRPFMNQCLNTELTWKEFSP